MKGFDRLWGIRALVVGFLAMLGAVCLLSVVQLVLWRGNAREELETLARVMGDNSSAALVFRNGADAEEVLAACRGATQVLAARLVLNDGLVLAQYRRADAPEGDPWPIQAVEQPVSAGGRQVGRIEMTASLEAVYREGAAFFLSGLLVMSIALGLAAAYSARVRRTVAHAEERAAHLSLHDALTGLPNRNYFQETLERAVVRLNREGWRFALLVMDLDGFKEVNDHHGHGVGDRLLVELAARLGRALRSSDYLARTAGDEFAIIVDDPDSAAAVAHLAERLSAIIRQPVEVGGASHGVGASIGIALAPADGNRADELLRKAHAALHHAKELGRGQCQFFSREIEERIRQRLSLEADLRDAWAQGQLSLAYQPIVAAADGRVAGLEALLRWKHPQRGAVPPSVFIPVAEDSGLITDLGLAVLKLVARDAAWMAAQGVAVPLIAVNLSYRQFARAADADTFLHTLAALDLHPGMVEFELTESTSLEDAQSGTHLVARLQQAGYRLAVDDFGTGYSSLAALRKLQNAKLKIDRSLVLGIADDGEARVIVAAIVGMARALAMPVVAEGVETEAEVALLTRLRCDYLQGYRFSRPLPPEELLGILAAGRIVPAATST